MIKQPCDQSKTFLAYEKWKACIGKATRTHGDAPRAPAHRLLGNKAELGLEPPVSVMSQARDWRLAFTGQVLVPATPGWAQTPMTVPEKHSYTWLLPVLQMGLFLGVSCPKRVTQCTTFTQGLHYLGLPPGFRQKTQP